MFNKDGKTIFPTLDTSLTFFFWFGWIAVGWAYLENVFWENRRVIGSWEVRMNKLFKHNTSFIRSDHGFTIEASPLWGIREIDRGYRYVLDFFQVYLEAAFVDLVFKFMSLEIRIMKHKIKILKLNLLLDCFTDQPQGNFLNFVSFNRLN